MDKIVKLYQSDKYQTSKSSDILIIKFTIYTDYKDLEYLQNTNVQLFRVCFRQISER